jgi:hypothetical protein
VPIIDLAGDRREALFTERLRRDRIAKIREQGQKFESSEKQRQTSRDFDRGGRP